MKITDLLSTKTINLNCAAKSKKEVIKKAVKLINNSGAICDIVAYEKGVFAREEESTTGVGEGIAIPHCKSRAVKKPALAAMVFKDGVEYDSLDGEPVQLLFLIAAPNTKDNVHLEVLARLSNLLMHPEFKENLLKAKTVKEFLKIIDDAENEKLEDDANKVAVQYPRILAATSCPTGVAHTYMAQEALEKAAAKLGHTIKVETNGASGVQNAITDDEIARAEVIIVAADAYIETDRFIGKRMIEVSVSRAIKDAEGLIIEAFSKKTPIHKGVTGRRTKEDIVEEEAKKAGFHVFYRHLMSGISHMIPFIVAGGILLALSFLIDACCGYKPTDKDFGQLTVISSILNTVGVKFGLGLMLPVLSAYIAYSISGRAGLVSGFIGGMAAKEGTFSLLYILLSMFNKDHPWVKILENSAAGFLGAIAAGFIAGYFVLFLKRKMANMPKSVMAVRDILLIPLLSVSAVGIAMMLVNVPVSLINVGMFTGLSKLQELNLTLLLAALVAGLMATDMGGPINKSAHYFTIMLIQYSTEHPEMRPLAMQLMAAHIVGAIVPPMAIALSSWLFPQKYTTAERSTSISNFITSLCGITEGAIPFAISDPIRTITSCVVGSAVGGLTCFALGFGCISPEGGTISMAVMGATVWKGLIGILVGATITTLMLGLWRRPVPPELAGLRRWKGIPTGFIDARQEKFIKNAQIRREAKKNSKTL